MTALAWAITERPRGLIVTNAAKIWTLLCIATDVKVKEVVHIPGVNNINCDRLSRRGTAPLMSVQEEAAEMSIVGAELVDFSPEAGIIEVLNYATQD